MTYILLFSCSMDESVFSSLALHQMRIIYSFVTKNLNIQAQNCQPRKLIPIFFPLVYAHLCTGMRNRSVGSHRMNDYSSRSHTILTVHITSEHQAEGSVFISKQGKGESNILRFENVSSDRAFSTLSIICFVNLNIFEWIETVFLCL